ncbi:hypothetical protein AgCh_025937 [Apium graveolens]
MSLSQLFNISTLQQLSISSNRLGGDIPATLEGCVMLEELYLEGNLFQRRIPSSFNALKSLAHLDLSNNNISGSIPSFFDGFSLIAFLNLSHNKLGGKVSREVLFSNLSALSVVGNLELCGGKGRYGSVYKGVLESVEHIVAVKVLNVEIHGVNKTFLAECETLRNIRHRNLIKIITACSTINFKGNNFKALVFEFMTNGSVDNCEKLHHHNHASIIHSDIKPSNILFDEDFVAHIGDFGLARFPYATSGNFNQAQMSSPGVHGTVRYVPPEYGVGGDVSIEGDVYSYGILLLEIFSGKRPTEGSVLVDAGSNLHNYVRKALPERVMYIADPGIIVDHEELGLTGNQSYNRTTKEVCLALIFEEGILCSEVMSQKRIDISVAIKQLQAAKDTLLKRRHDLPCIRQEWSAFLSLASPDPVKQISDRNFYGVNYQKSGTQLDVDFPLTPFFSWLLVKINTWILLKVVTAFPILV